MKRFRFFKQFIACLLVLVFAFSGIAASDSSVIYQNAADKLAKGEYAEAAELFGSISTYKDSAAQADTCRQKLYEQAERKQIWRICMMNSKGTG